MRTLLVIDMQDGFINENTEHIVKRVTELTRSDDFDRVILTVFVNPVNSRFREVLNYNDMGEDDPNTRLHDSVRDLDATVFVKTTYSVPSDIVNLVRHDTVTVVGTDTDGCVLATVFDLFDAGVDVTVDRDGVASTLGGAQHDAGMIVLDNVLGAIG